MTLLAEAEAFAHKYPTPHSHPNGGDFDWHNDCAAFVSRFGTFTTPGFQPSTYGPTAYDVGGHSHIVSTNPNSAPAGAVHFFTTGPSRGRDGHVGVQTEKGMVSATNATGGRRLAPEVNITLHPNIAAYLRAKPDMHYRGWAHDYAGARFAVPATTSTASLGTVTKIVEALMSNSPTGKAVIYDSGSGVRYLFDVTATPGIYILGPTSNAEAIAIAAGSRAKRLSTSQVRALCDAYGVAPIKPGRAATLPKNTVGI